MVRLRTEPEPAVLRRVAQGDQFLAGAVQGGEERRSLVLPLQEYRQPAEVRRLAQAGLIAATMPALAFAPPPPASPEAETLRAEVRAFLATAMADRPAAKRAQSWSGFDPAFSRKIGEQGWVGMTFRVGSAPLVVRSVGRMVCQLGR